MGYFVGFCFLVMFFLFGLELISEAFSVIKEGGVSGWLLGGFLLFCGIAFFPIGVGAPIIILVAAFLCASKLFRKYGEKEPVQYKNSEENHEQYNNQWLPTYQQNTERYNIDFDILLNFFRDRASSGDYMAQACIGLVHRAKDCEPDALYDLAVIFSENKVVARDKIIATELFIRSNEARQGILKKDNITKENQKPDNPLHKLVNDYMRNNYF